jgi:hypothetical protein
MGIALKDRISDCNFRKLRSIEATASEKNSLPGRIN